MPRCLRAVAWSGTRARKAPTVVILPTSRGIKISFTAWRISL